MKCLFDMMIAYMCKRCSMS